MKTTVMILSLSLVAPWAYAQQTSEQATEQGRQENTQYASDAAVTTKVHTALANDVGMRTLTRIHVDTTKGVVTLKGDVDSADTKRRAEETAKKVSGVASVKNELKVKG